jgi:uncharacterized membrane protein YebE (DUF533 family)
MAFLGGLAVSAVKNLNRPVDVNDTKSMPLDLDGIIRDVRDPMVGAQVYAASLLSIEVDTAAEQDYLRRLAAGLQLGPEAVARIHQILGVS